MTDTESQRWRHWTKHLEMRLRATAPRQLRTAYRVSRAIRPPRYSLPLPPELLDDCRLCADREALIARLPASGVVAELGTYKGAFARSIRRISTPRALHLIDIDWTPFLSEGLGDDVVTRHTGMTYEVIASFPDATFDWIYIDGDHSYDGCLRDARAAALKVKPGGFLVFNDFAHADAELGRYGVHAAVVDFMIAERWPMRFFAYHGAALYDVALQRPQ